MLKQLDKKRLDKKLDLYIVEKARLQVSKIPIAHRIENKNSIEAEKQQVKRESADCNEKLWHNQNKLIWSEW